MRREPVSRDAFSPDDVLHYKRAIARRGALTAALNYYRALGRYPAELRRGNRPITAPTLLIWGERDRYLGIEMTEGLSRWVPQLQVSRIPDASHWVQNDAPERVNRLLVEFLRPMLVWPRRGATFDLHATEKAPGASTAIERVIARGCSCQGKPPWHGRSDSGLPTLPSQDRPGNAPPTGPGAGRTSGLLAGYSDRAKLPEQLCEGCTRGTPMPGS